MLGRGQFTWTWHVAPSFLGRIYTLRVEFKQGGRPQVFVDQPDLVALAEGRKLPHIYRGSRQLAFALCPNVGRIARRLAHRQHAVPWAALWLCFLEEWLVSDDWKGGGCIRPTMTWTTERLSGNHHGWRSWQAHGKAA